jgi:hypothetical protein
VEDRRGSMDIRNLPWSTEKQGALAPMRRASAATLSSNFNLRPMRQVLTFCAASASAIAFPTPLPPPVMTAVFFDKTSIGFKLLIDSSDFGKTKIYRGFIMPCTDMA